jgi:hypothetical protein
VLGPGSGPWFLALVARGAVFTVSGRAFAALVAGDRVYLVPPEVISDIASRLTGARDSIRIQARTLGRAGAALVIMQILHARRALPSQWLPSLTVRRVADG